MGPALTLANTPLDLQITICIFLHPSDILSLRKTCKALELATRKRIVWMAVLHQVCLDNTLFLPSFPIPDMSDLELERAAMAPRRWIKLCGEFQKQHSNESSEMLRPQTTRLIMNAADSVFIVPGGRYLVTAGWGLFVWDLGYVSTVGCKLVASTGLGDLFQLCMVQATPDGKGLVITSSFISGPLSIFEIYPQSEIPLLTRIAHLDRVFTENPAHLLPDTVIFRFFLEDRIVFRIVNYRTNCSTCLSADVDVKKFGANSIRTFAMKTAIIVSCNEGILIWAIPPLSPQSSDRRDHPLNNNPTHIPPLFKIPFPDDTEWRHSIIRRMPVPSWYSGSWESVYFDILFNSSKLKRFKIIIEPDHSDAFLHVINVSETVSDSFMYIVDGYRQCEGYRICEDALVYFWNKRLKYRECTGFILTSTPFTNVVTRWNKPINDLCPTSGRFVHCDLDDNGDKRIVVDDLF